jgi:hypothetical protein
MGVGMMYVIASKDEAEKAHIRTSGHRVKDGKVILNEKEVNVCSTLSGSLEERAAQLGGEVYTYESAMQVINEGGWKYE